MRLQLIRMHGRVYCLHLRGISQSINIGLFSGNFRWQSCRMTKCTPIPGYFSFPSAILEEKIGNSLVGWYCGQMPLVMRQWSVSVSTVCTIFFFVLENWPNSLPTQDNRWLMHARNCTRVDWYVVFDKNRVLHCQGDSKYRGPSTPCVWPVFVFIFCD